MFHLHRPGAIWRPRGVVVVVYVYIGIVTPAILRAPPITLYAPWDAPQIWQPSTYSGGDPPHGNAIDFNKVDSILESCPFAVTGADDEENIRAAHDGTIQTHPESAIAGWYIDVISSENPTYRTRYAHLKYDPTVNPGVTNQFVTAGTIIGKCGQTGLATGPHLHFELRNQFTTVPIDRIQDQAVILNADCLDSQDSSRWLGRPIKSRTTFAITFVYTAIGLAVLPSTVNWGPHSIGTINGVATFTDVPCATYPLSITGPWVLNASFGNYSSCDPSQPALGCERGNCVDPISTGEDLPVPHDGGFSIGQRVQVCCTGGIGLRAWTDICSNGYIVKPDGSQGVIVEESQCCGGYIRWKILWDGESIPRWSAEGEPSTQEMWLQAVVPPCNNAWSAGFPGINGPVFAMTTWDRDGAGPLPPVLVAGGSFTMAGTTPVSNIAAWNGFYWESLGSGLGPAGNPQFHEVDALAVYDGKLIAGGGFYLSGVESVSHIAQWDGTSWQPLDSGMDSTVYALCVYNGRLIAGGGFFHAGGLSVGRIAQWDGTTWTGVGQFGFSNGVLALIEYGGELVAAGHFTYPGNRIARWNGAIWQTLGSGIDAGIVEPHLRTLTVHNGNLIAAGSFSNAGGAVAWGVAQWNGTSWTPLGSGISGGTVYASAVYNGNLLVAGTFTSAGGVAANNIAQWNGSSWMPLGSGLNSNVRTLSVFSGEIICGGDFTSAGGVATNFLAQWSPDCSLCPPEERAELIASDAAAFDNFGFSVAVSGNTSVIGAPQADGTVGSNSGSAYVFVRSSSSWIQQTKLTPSDAAANDFFGISTTVLGDTAVVGAAFDDHSGETDAGSAYVFVRANGEWIQQAKLTASDAAEQDWFGYSVAVSDATAVVGAPLDVHAGGTRDGSAYVFVRANGEWIQQAKLTASDAAEQDWFGFPVGVSGNTVVVGAYLDDHAGGTDAGSVYVFVRSDGVWTQQAKLTASDAAAFDSFGFAVSVSGDVIVVGAPWDDDAVGTHAGSAYVFVRSGAVWTEQAKLSASDASSEDLFGYSVAQSEDTVVVGALLDTLPCCINAGSAYTFTCTGSVWTQQAKLTSSSAAEGDYSGRAVAISGDTILIGVYADNSLGGADSGSVYVFHAPNAPNGDVNPDGAVNGIDVQRFVIAINNSSTQIADLCHGDFNLSGMIDAGDIPFFVNRLLIQTP